MCNHGSRRSVVSNAIRTGPFVTDYSWNLNSRLAAKRCLLGVAGSWPKPCPFYRDSPRENGYNDSFNRKLGDERLTMEICATLKGAEVLIEQWRRTCNNARPYGAPANRTPSPKATLPPAARPAYGIGPAYSWLWTIPDPTSGTGPPRRSRCPSDGALNIAGF